MRKFETFLKIILGNFILAFAVNMFVIPFGFISGGTTGIALILQHFTSLSFSSVVIAINIIMFIVGYLLLGKQFALTTLLSSCIYPVFVTVTENVDTMFKLTNDPLVACVLGSIMLGFALGLVIQSNASTGGMDIPPLVMQRYFKLNVAVALYIQDFIILIIQMFFTPVEGILCGLIMLFLISFVMNQVLTFGKSQCQIMIITKNYEEMRDLFIVELNKGATLFKIETGYLKEDQKAICAILSQKELTVIKDKIYELDKNAFMIVSKVQEVRGLGFKPWDKNNFLMEKLGN